MHIINFTELEFIRYCIYRTSVKLNLLTQIQVHHCPPVEPPIEVTRLGSNQRLPVDARAKFYRKKKKKT
ncbi:unnamed protein product [Musa acuminata subsp. burmannicoides]